MKLSERLRRAEGELAQGKVIEWKPNMFTESSSSKVVKNQSPKRLTPPLKS
jgi:hypothetical protein